MCVCVCVQYIDIQQYQHTRPMSLFLALLHITIWCFIRNNRKLFRMANLNQEQMCILASLTNTSCYVAKKKVTFDAFSSLCGLQENNGINMGKQYRSGTYYRKYVMAIVDQETETPIKESRLHVSGQLWSMAQQTTRRYWKLNDYACI